MILVNVIVLVVVKPEVNNELGGGSTIKSAGPAVAEDRLRVTLVVKVIVIVVAMSWGVERTLEAV